MSETPTDKVKRDTGDVGGKSVLILGTSWKVRELIQLLLLVGTALGFGAKAIGDTQFGATAAQQQQTIQKLDSVHDKLGELKHQVELQGKDLEALKVQQNGQADAIRKLQGDVDELKKRKE